jgi:uncharacterized protein involved in exopolysaccharide biosynthesis
MNPDVTPTPGSPARHAAGARDLLTVVFRRRGIILGLFLIVTVTVVALTLTRPVVYISFARVLVKRGEQESSMTPGRRFTGWEEEMATEAQVVNSWTVRERAQQAVDAARRAGVPPLRLNADAVDVQVIGQSNVMEIAYVARSADQAHSGCDAIVNAYVDYRSSSETLPYPKAFFESELKRVAASIDSLSRVRRQFTEAQDVVDLGEERRSLLHAIGGMKHDRIRVFADLAEATTNLRGLTAMHQNPEMDVPVFSEGFVNEEALRELKKSIIQQETRIARLQELYRDDAPELVDARASLESMRGLLRREVEQALKLTQARGQGLRARAEAVDRQIAETEAQLLDMPAKEARLTDLDQKLTVLRARYLDLTQDSDQAKVTEQTSRRVSVVVLSPPTPGRARNTRDYIRLALAPAFSLLVGVGLAFFLDGLDSRLRTARDVEDALGLPVLASLNERKKARA